MTTLEETLESNRPSPLQVLAPIAALIAVGLVMASGAGQETVWYVIRASGVVAYALLAASVVVGLLITNRALPAGRPRVDLYEVHIFTSLLAIAFTGVHGLALLLDSFITFTPVQVLVPFTSDYRPFAVGLGVIGLYVAVAVYLSFYARKAIGYKMWRTLHYASFLAFALAAGHSILSGTDSETWWMVVIYVGSVVGVMALTLRRIAMAGPPQPRTA